MTFDVSRTGTSVRAQDLCTHDHGTFVLLIAKNLFSHHLFTIQPKSSRIKKKENSDTGQATSFRFAVMIMTVRVVMFVTLAQCVNVETETSATN